MAEFRVVMTCISTHNGLTFHYNTYISRHICTVLAVAAVTGPHHQFLDLHHFSSSKFYMVSKEQSGKVN